MAVFNFARHKTISDLRDYNALQDKILVYLAVGFPLSRVG